METIIGTRIFITGAPGSGKSFMSSLFNDAVNLDDYGSNVDGKWIVDITKLPQGDHVYEGVCDNFADVMRAINPSIILFTLSDVSTNRRVSRIRYESDMSAPFASAWKERMSWSEKTFLDYQKKLISEVRSAINAPVILIDNTPASRRFWGLSVKWNPHGWHAFKK
jgi:hypothetical protein